MKDNHPTFIKKEIYGKGEVFKYINHKYTKKFNGNVYVYVKDGKIKLVSVDMFEDLYTTKDVDELIDILKRAKEYLKHKEELEGK